jgi:hypothetical protein
MHPRIEADDNDTEPARLNHSNQMSPGRAVIQQKHHRGIIRAVGVAVVLWPISALADVGTPLVWGSIFHLFIGNALIGLFEGWLLARFFGLLRRRCTGFLILANYLSAWVGMMLMSFLFNRYATDINSGLRVTWLLVVASYLLTLLIEWPFVALCFRGTPRWFTGSIKGSLLVQSASYVLLFGGYWLLSGTSLYTGMRVVSPDQIAAPPGIVMFFISRADGDVYRSELGSFTDTKVAELNSTNSGEDRLELKETWIDGDYWDLVVVQERHQVEVLVPRISSKDQIPDQQGWRTAMYGGWGPAAFQVGAATNSNWKFSWAFWPDIGMWGRSGSDKIRIAFGIPFGGWSPLRVIHLPGDKALLQLEDRQICLVDVPGRKIARIKDGYGVLAFQKDQIVETNGAANGSQPIRLLTVPASSAAGSSR